MSELDEQIADEIIGGLDTVARNYEQYEFGLPLYSEEQNDLMRRVVLAAFEKFGVVVPVRVGDE